MKVSLSRRKIFFSSNRQTSPREFLNALTYIHLYRPPPSSIFPEKFQAISHEISPSPSSKKEIKIVAIYEREERKLIVNESANIQRLSSCIFRGRRINDVGKFALEYTHTYIHIYIYIMVRCLGDWRFSQGHDEEERR